MAQKNWGQNPIIVSVGFLASFGGLIGLAYTIYGFHIGEASRSEERLRLVPVGIEKTKKQVSIGGSSLFSRTLLDGISFEYDLINDGQSTIYIRSIEPSGLFQDIDFLRSPIHPGQALVIQTDFLPLSIDGNLIYSLHRNILLSNEKKRQDTGDEKIFIHIKTTRRKFSYSSDIRKQFNAYLQEYRIEATKREEIKTEIEDVRKVISKNIEQSFSLVGNE